MKRKADFDLVRGSENDDDDQVLRTSVQQAPQTITPNQTSSAPRRIVKLKVPDCLLDKQKTENQDPKLGTFKLVGKLGSTQSNHQISGNNQETNEIEKIPDIKKNDIDGQHSEKVTILTNYEIMPKELTEEETKNEEIRKVESAKSSKKKIVVLNRKKDSELTSEHRVITAPQNQPVATGPNLFQAILGDKPRLNLFSQNLSGLFPKKEASEQKPQVPLLFNTTKVDDFFGKNKEGPSSETKNAQEQAPAQNSEEKPRFTLFPNLAAPQTSNNLFKSNLQDLFKSAKTSELFKNPSLENKDEESDIGEDGEEGDDDEGKAKEEENVNEETFNDPGYDRVCFSRVTKFKGGDKPLQNDGEISILKTKQGSAHFLIYRNRTKRIMYQGQIIPKLSSVAFVNDKKEAVIVGAFTKKEKTEGEQDRNFVKDFPRVMFYTSEECVKFKKVLDDMIANKN